MTVKITDTSLRDAHQSLYATRMKTEDMVPILEQIDAVGYHSLEMWGGATFDTCMRYLDEDPWERLRTIRKHVKNTKLQMLLRGQNILGYKNYPDDVVEEFVKRSIANGIDIFRIFDALNDTRNMERAIKVTNQEGGHAQGSISYTISPVHDISVFVKMAKKLEELGCDSICIKDMAGLLAPYTGYDLVTSLKEEVDLPIQLHSHSTSGMAATTYLKAIEAGVDMVDTAISPLAMGTSQPPIEPLEAMLDATENELELNEKALRETTAYFKDIKEKYKHHSKLSVTVDANVLTYQVPGGMLSNLASQLSQANALDKYDEALEETPKVRKELGYPPLVTPTSQIVGNQAVMNVITGERYKMISEEVKNYVAGYYGKPPFDIDEEVKNMVLKNKEAITSRPADYLDPMMDGAREELKEKGYYEQEEDVLSYCLFPKVAEQFFKKRKEGTLGEGEESSEKEEQADSKEKHDAESGGEVTAPAAGEARKFQVTVDGESYQVEVALAEGSPEISSVAKETEPAPKKSAPKKSTPESNDKNKVDKSEESSGKGGGGGKTITAPIAGNVLEVKISAGDQVESGQVVMILEAMKMENEITADQGGTIKSVKVSKDDSVSSGDVLVKIE